MYNEAVSYATKYLIKLFKPIVVFELFSYTCLPESAIMGACVPPTGEKG